MGVMGSREGARSQLGWAKLTVVEEQGTPKANLAPGNQARCCSAPHSDRRAKARAHLIQAEIGLLNLSQGVSEEAEHELLYLEPVDSP